MGGGITKPRGEIKQNLALGQIGIFELTNPSERNLFIESDEALETIRTIQSQQSFNDWYGSAIKIMDDDESNNVILFPQHHYFTRSGICGTVQQINLVFQNYEYVLSEQILNRNKKKTNFTQAQMWYILYSFIKAGRVFQLRKRNKMGNFHSSKVVINDHGHIKFVSILSLPDEITNFQRLSQQETCKLVYLAPQEFIKSDIKKGMYPIQVDPCKADVFSIGMTLLSAGLLMDISDVYIQQENSLWFIHADQVNRKIQILSTIYGNLFVHYIKSMLQFDPRQRKKCSEIYENLKQFDQQIMNLAPFAFRQSVSNVNNSSIRNSEIPIFSSIRNQSNQNQGNQKQFISQISSKSDLKSNIEQRQKKDSQKVGLRKTTSFAASEYF